MALVIAVFKWLRAGLRKGNGKWNTVWEEKGNPTQKLWIITAIINAAGFASQISEELTPPDERWMITFNGLIPPFSTVPSSPFEVLRSLLWIIIDKLSQKGVDFAESTEPIYKRKPLRLPFDFRRPSKSLISSSPFSISRRPEVDRSRVSLVESSEFRGSSLTTSCFNLNSSSFYFK
ncbi:hypothetical protein Ddc_01077 [Ditylenchus destructor]|nr:hypothetical protein Ddc_01077 [Ditylenchus destructor]